MIHLRPTLAIARKDAQDVIVDKSKLLGVLLPVLLTLLYLLIGKLAESHPLTLLVYNPGQSRLEQVVGNAFATPHITHANAPVEVSAAFGPDGTQKNTLYDVGLIIPADFEQRLQAGDHPQVSLYVNGSSLDAQRSGLLQAAITNYARTVAAPTPPANLIIATINSPAPTTDTTFSLTKFYSFFVLPLSFLVGVGLMPGLLIEEKEKKTLRMLMVSPASFGDVIAGKLLAVLVYQLAVSSIVLAIMGGFAGNVPLLVLYMLVGSCFALALGLLFGSMMQTTGAAGAVASLAIFAFIVPAIIVPLTPYLGGANPIVEVVKALPTYYVAEGAYNAAQSQGSFSSNLLDVGVTLGSAIVALLLTAWVLRRQAAVTGSI